MKLTPYIFLALVATAFGEPMETREFTATSGHKTAARALSATAVSVELELTSGKTIELLLEKLIPADRETILGHFGIGLPKEGEPVRSDAEPADPSGFDQPLGKVSGAIESAPGSHYLIYLPTTLKKGRPAPLLHFNDSGNVDAGRMTGYVDGCERFGWILVGSVESSNETHGDPNHKHAANNVTAMKESGLIDPERIYFTGSSGGGAMSWWNHAKLRSAGTMPVIGYIPREVSPSGGHHFVIGGARDYNRYLGANAADKFKKDSFYLAYPGGHASAEEPWVSGLGIAWLTARYLEDNDKDSGLAGDRLDFEAAAIKWMDDLGESEPYLAYHLGKIMQDTYKVSGKNAEIISKKVTELGQTTANVQFSAGLVAISDFAKSSMADAGSGGGSAFNKAFPDQTRKAERLAVEYSGTPFVEKVLLELAQPTVGQ